MLLAIIIFNSELNRLVRSYPVLYILGLVSNAAGLDPTRDLSVVCIIR